MEKNEITLSFDSVKLEALEFALRKEHSSVRRRLTESLRQLYEQTVPEPVREYLDVKSAPTARPKRPPRPSRPKGVSPKPAPAPMDQGKEGSV